MSEDTDRGFEFEREFARRHDMKPVPGSGSQWHSKLDTHGRGVRWSLKSTQFGSFQISKALIEEIVEATESVGGTDEIPMMAIELDNRRDPIVLVVMREADFAALASEEMNLVRESKAQARRRTAEIPQLLRDGTNGDIQD